MRTLSKAEKSKMFQLLLVLLASCLVALLVGLNGVAAACGLVALWPLIRLLDDRARRSARPVSLMAKDKGRGTGKPR